MINCNSLINNFPQKLEFKYFDKSHYSHFVLQFKHAIKFSMCTKLEIPLKSYTAQIKQKSEFIIC